MSRRFFVINMKTVGAAVVGVAVSLIPVDNAQAAQLVMDFSNNAGLGFGIGTTQTITQNGIQMQSIAGKYEITNPEHELNLKDFSSSIEDPTRTVQFSLLSGNPFDFIGFKLKSAFGNITITSSQGGNITFDPRAAPSDFSGPEWKNLSFIQVSTSQRFGEVKFNSFTFDNEPTAIPTPALLPGLLGMGIAAWRKRKNEEPEQVAETAEV
jgi:hypothetical protein